MISTSGMKDVEMVLALMVMQSRPFLESQWDCPDLPGLKSLVRIRLNTEASYLMMDNQKSPLTENSTGDEYVASADTASEGSRMRDVGTQIVRGRHVNCRNFPSINLGSSADKNTACKLVSGERLEHGIGPMVLTTRHALHILQDA